MSESEAKSDHAGPKKPRVIKYEIKRVRRRWFDAASRYALTSVLGSAGAVTPSRDEEGSRATAKALLNLQLLWRQRLNALRDLKLKWLNQDTWYGALNCPPVSVMTSPSHRPCQMAHVCPFCWARRYVLEPCDRISYVFYGCPSVKPLHERYGRAPIPKHPALLDLVEIVTEYRVPPDVMSLSQLFAEIDAPPGRESLIREYGYIGAFQLYTIEPPDRRMPQPCWVWSRRILAIAEIGTRDPHAHTEAPAGAISGFRRVRRHSQINRRVLAAAIGRTSRYPSQILRGPLDSFRELLEFQHGFRRDVESGRKPRGFKMSGTYGVLRNRSARLRDAKLAALRTRPEPTNPEFEY